MLTFPETKNSKEINKAADLSLYWYQHDPVIQHVIDLMTGFISSGINGSNHMEPVFLKRIAREFLLLGTYSVAKVETEYSLFHPDTPADAIKNLCFSEPFKFVRNEQVGGMLCPLFKVLSYKERIHSHKEELSLEKYNKELMNVKSILADHFGNTTLIKYEIFAFRKALEMLLAHDNLHGGHAVLAFEPIDEKDIFNMSVNIRRAIASE